MRDRLDRYFRTFQSFMISSFPIEMPWGGLKLKGAANHDTAAVAKSTLS